MNIKNIFSNTKLRNTLLFSIVIILIIITLILQKTAVVPTSQTIPLPTNNVVTPPNYQEPIANTTGIFVSQKLSFVWNISPTEFPSAIKNYAIVKPLINLDTISSLSKQLGFTANDKKRSIKNTTNIWSNSSASLFTSTEQNQIIYQKTSILTENLGSITATEAIEISQSILAYYFGESFVQTLNLNPTVKYLKPQANSYSPIEVSNPESAVYIEVSYRQDIDGLPVASLSGTSDILSVAIDTQRNLYRFAIYGGYLNLKEQNTASIINFETLKTNAPKKAQKITSINSISGESQFGNTTDITISVNKLNLGYFLRNDNNLYPVFFISGNATGKNIPPTPVTYIVPAVQN